MKQPQIEITADGSATLYIPEIDEHYHSVKGALTESLHIFIQTGFHYSKADPLTIFEVGFGTGLNAFLTLLECEKLQRKTRLPHNRTLSFDNRTGKQPQISRHDRSGTSNAFRNNTSGRMG